MHKPAYLAIRREIAKVFEDPKLTARARLEATQQLVSLYKIHKMGTLKGKGTRKPRKQQEFPASSNLNRLAEKIETKEEIQ